MTQMKLMNPHIPKQEIIQITAVDQFGFAPNAVEICRDVRVLSLDQALATFYVPGAVLPTGEWVTLNEAERAQFIAPGTEFSRQCNIGLTRLENDEFNQIQAILISAGYSQRLSDERGYVGEAITRLERHIIERFRGSLNYVSQGLKSTAPGLETTAIDRDVGGLAGLHLDAWDGVTLSERKAARVRVTINFGPDPRHLLFVPYKIEAMKAMLAASGIHISDINRVWPEFARTFSAIPVLRIRLEPADIYIAATDYFVHDGATQEATNRTFTVQIRSDFFSERTASV